VIITLNNPISDPAIATYWGSGSRDLYPQGALGMRSKLVSHTNRLYDEAYPYINPGVHKVFLNAGEKLYLGSSAQGMLVGGTDPNNYGAIRVFKPSSSGRTIADNNAGYASLKDVRPDHYSGTGSEGTILGRPDELLGPKIGTGAGYEPFVVEADETGIYEVWFYAPLTGDGSSKTGNSVDPGTVDVANNPTWVQHATGHTVTAWDATVTDAAGNIKPGRTYLNVFNGAATTDVSTAGFYGNFYVVTKDGFPYLVEGNGLAGLYYTFFVNNRGFTTESNGGGLRTYKSQRPFASPAFPNYNIKNPNQEDDALNITHKLFYGIPGGATPGETTGDLPETATYNGGTTWVKLQNPPDPTAENIKFVGVEGSDGYGGSKGAYIEFEANVAGTYRITIPGNPAGGFHKDENDNDVPNVAPFYYERVLVGGSVLGHNKIFWDGRTGDEDDPLVPAGLLPPGATMGTIKVQLTGAEVHFPYLDMEANVNGVKVIQLDKNYYTPPNLVNNPEKDLVWWDDTDASGNRIGDTGYTDANPLVVNYNGPGQPSSTNGHKYGGSGSNGYGNRKGIDTYSFVPGPESTLSGVKVEIKETDLQVTAFTSSLDHSQSVSVGNSYTYTATVRNAGNMTIQTQYDPVDGSFIIQPARFNIYVPAGIRLDINSLVFTPTGGVTQQTEDYLGAVDPNLEPSFVPDPATGGGVFTYYLNMPIGGEATFTITAHVDAGVKQTSNGLINAYATILRPKDFSDPNATNPSLDITTPVDPFREAIGITSGISDPDDPDAYNKTGIIYESEHLLCRCLG
jgi:hypothetical protein